MTHLSNRRLALTALLIAAYFVAGRLGLELAFLNKSASAVWPPTGIALGALLIWGYAVWPAIAIGAFLVNYSTTGIILPSIGIAAGNTLEAVIGCWLVNTYANGPRALERVVDVFRFALLAAGVSTTLSATIGVTCLALSDLLAPSEIGSVWFTWWLGDLSGALVVTPFVLAWASGNLTKKIENNHYWEIMCFALVLFIVSQVVFSGVVFQPIKHYPLDALCVPVIVWAGFRLGLHVTTAGILLLAGIAIANTLAGFGPFVADSPNVSLLLLQTYLGLLSLTGLVVAAGSAERQSAEAESVAARAEAERANGAKDSFVATLSHELRSPLNAILGWAQLLQRRELPPEKIAEGLKVIERNTRAQAKLISDLLDMSRIVSGNVRLERQRLDLRQLLEAAVQTFQPLAYSKGITLRTSLPSLSIAIEGDAARIQQVFANLLSNALKFTPGGGKISVELRESSGRAVIEVSDSGCGIAPEFLPRIFERFSQADNSITKDLGGLGLGLSISKELVELHHGTIEVVSAGVGLGATFTVTLPSAPAARLPEDSPSDARPLGAEESATLLNGINILVVDDQEDSRSLLCTIAAQSGAQVLSARSGIEALAAFSDHQPDILISDLAMPTMDGYELIKKIRARPASQGGNVPAIAVSARARPEDKRRALDSGFQRHMAKPIDAGELMQTIWLLTLRSGDLTSEARQQN